MKETPRIEPTVKPTTLVQDVSANSCIKREECRIPIFRAVIKCGNESKPIIGVIDTGSQRSFIAESVVKMMGINYVGDESLKLKLLSGVTTVRSFTEQLMLNYQAEKSKNSSD